LSTSSSYVVPVFRNKVLAAVEAVEENDEKGCALAFFA
jgi:hypothetical protein